MSWQYRLPALIVVVLATAVVGCVEESSTPVSFNTTLESTFFRNRLLAPVVLYRDGTFLDTLPARSFRSYPLNRVGPVRHSWKLVSPRDRFGRQVGVEPVVQLGIQYRIRGEYEIDNEGVPGHTLFAPMVANFTAYDLRLIANYEEDDQVYTDYLVPRSIDTLLRHAPYFYWHSSSNVKLEAINASYSIVFSRTDTTETRHLELDDTDEFEGSGRTVPRVAY